jgi:hypothetical protein
LDGTDWAVALRECKQTVLRAQALSRGAASSKQADQNLLSLCGMLRQSRCEPFGYRIPFFVLTIFLE